MNNCNETLLIQEFSALDQLKTRFEISDDLKF